MAIEQTHLRVGNEMRRVWDVTIERNKSGYNEYYFYPTAMGKDARDTPCRIPVGQCSFYDAVLTPQDGVLILSGVTKKGEPTL